MKAIAVSIVALLLLLGTVAPLLADDVSVKGYFRNDGTYVQPHMRSTSDSSYNNNWSTYPNTNPFTGQQRTHQPRLFDNNSNSGGYGYGLGGGSKQRSR